MAKNSESTCFGRLYKVAKTSSQRVLVGYIMWRKISSQRVLVGHIVVKNIESTCFGRSYNGEKH